MIGNPARDTVLGRIRAALGPGERPSPRAVPRAVPREYRVRGSHEPGHPALLDLLADRLEDYRASVRRCPPGAIAAAVSEALTARGTLRLAVPHGIDQAWLTAGWDGETLRDSPESPLPVAVLDSLDGVVTECTVAIAETGTIVLDGTPGCGRRVVTLVPDYHLVIVRAAQVVASVPEGLARLDPQRPLTMISGPSATSDIELSRVEGVHGPRTLDVILVC